MLKMTCYDDVIEFKAAKTILGRPLYFSHFYYLDGVLIDTGPSHVSAEVLQSVKGLPIEKIIITHQHEDHTGNIALLSKELGVPVYAHPETIRVIDNPPKIEIYRKIIWGRQPSAGAKPLEDFFTNNRFKLQTIYTGGHSRDHVCFFEPHKRWLFAGDFYLGENLTAFMIGENIAEHLAALHKIIALKPDIIFCGLKGRLEDATARLARKSACWWELGCRVKELYDKGVARGEILAKVFGGEISFFYFSQSNWGRRYMLDSIINNIDIFNSDTKIIP